MVLVILVVGAFLLSGCGEKTVQCPSAGSYSSCNEDGVKTRTNYRVVENECQSYTEEKQCATTINIKGTGLDATISPSIEKNVKGVISIDVTVGDDIKLVAVGLGGGDLPELGSGSEYMFATESDGVWTVMIDTTDYGNGLYDIGVVGSTDGDSPPSAYGTGQMVISN